MMSVNVVYTTGATATGGRDGKASVEGGALEVALAVPKEMGGNGKGNNPEQLFAAGYAACYLGALKYVASQDKSFHVPAETTVASHVGIGPRSDGGFGLVVSLDVHLPGMDDATAAKLFAKTHEVCPYSNATRGNLDVKTRLV
jgi:Ohr subfamily peroxiredoxin